ncbi:hypothetical protein SMACR_08418 [Sordaria macrospora]|uniref:WGS project CABT00000000 data, contig 2.57 n=2 Tax=Sordaria macrospora TaxID=5147 RepID=F7WA38_SORMK|nr:uncharacterized protein SMAC_08418 [Sordaria macrospora k-hell]KAA8629332.1 hypothetical protein SMACR_08418 [Sordaria macrospora]WPJ62570.1 hypothetical protein SMAC4_08418 [Sordaria macrospora]CCC14106.1 unnamed protein product [Sordaria macrospora k-hell]
MSQPNTTLIMPARYDHLRKALQAYRDDPLVESFLSGARDIIFDADGDLILTVGDEHDSRNFRVRSCLLRQHSSRFDSRLGPMCVEASISNDPIRCSIRYDDVSTFFFLVLYLHRNIWCSSPLPLKTLVRFVRTTYFSQFDKELPDGNSPLRKALEHCLASTSARLDEDEMASKWTLMKCAFFVGDRASFARVDLELVRRHAGSLWDLEAQLGELLGQDEGQTTYLHVPEDRDSVGGTCTGAIHAHHATHGLSSWHFSPPDLSTDSFSF